MKKRDFNTEIWEGWTIQDIIDELDTILKLIQTGKSYRKPITTKEELKKWCIDNQPYNKDYVPEVVEYFVNKYNIK